MRLNLIKMSIKQVQQRRFEQHLYYIILNIKGLGELNPKNWREV